MTYLLAGDSTVSTYLECEEPMSGWGAYLGRYVDSPVLNFAIRGATTASFIADGAWRTLLERTVAGDTVLIQFGHNDQKEPTRLDARGGYTERLSGMVADARAHGAEAVLCTSTERRWFHGERITPTHGDYPNAVRDLADRLGTPLIDLTVFTTWLYEYLGPDRSRSLLSHFTETEFPGWPQAQADDTHFRDRGADAIARFVALSLRAIERRDGDVEPGGMGLADG